MRLFVCEFITAGGMRNSPLTGSLLCEAEMMLNALLTDLRELGHVQSIITRDNRLSSLPESISSIDENDNVWSIWARLMKDCDAVWCIAPESEEILMRLRVLADMNNCDFIGCGETAISITSSKLKTADHFSERNIQCIPTVQANEILPESEYGWVVKPDMGVGSESTWFFDNKFSLEKWLSARAELDSYIMQPYVKGRAASLSVVYGRDGARILACNEQLVIIKDSCFSLTGINVNGLQHRIVELTDYVEKIGIALPDLSGYVGIDFIDTDFGEVLVEINPRLTTSYAGLRKSLGFNVAEYVIEQYLNKGVNIVSNTMQPINVAVPIHHE